MVKIFSASLDSLHAMLEFIKAHAQTMGFNEEAINKIELASEEAIVNIIKYAYPQNNGSITLQVNEEDISGINLTIIDQGIPFNPLENPPLFNPSLTLDERRNGGCGIYFITHLMDNVNYLRGEDNSNILILTKKLNS